MKKAKYKVGHLVELNTEVKETSPFYFITGVIDRGDQVAYELNHGLKSVLEVEIERAFEQVKTSVKKTVKRKTKAVAEPMPDNHPAQ